MSNFELILHAFMFQHPEIKIKQIRELKNLTQEHISNQLGLSVRAYSKIESGETQLTINRLKEISAILEIDPIEILGFNVKNIFSIHNSEENSNHNNYSVFKRTDFTFKAFNGKIKYNFLKGFYKFSGFLIY